MGIVYKARQVKADRIVALKTIRTGSAATPGERQRFQTEAHAVARLQHPGVVQIFEVGEYDGAPYFSLEYVSGRSLHRKLADGPMPPEQAASLVAAMAEAVQAAHYEGIVHRDLKPANVLLTHDGLPKVTDFGLAKCLDLDAGQTQSGAVLGTPSYMAPEQAGGKSKLVGPCTDIYALGAILYACLTGRPPFQAATTMDTVLLVLSNQPVPPRQLVPTVPRDLEAICLQCLEKQPGRRYTSAAALADDLSRFLRGGRPEARLATAAGRIANWVRQPRSAAFVILLCALVALLVLSFFPWLGLFLGERTPLVTQSAWQAIYGGFSLREHAFVEDPAIFGTNRLLAAYLFQLVLLLTWSLAIGLASMLATSLPPWLQRLQAWRWRVVAGVSLLAFLTLGLQLATGFSLEINHERQVRRFLAEQDKKLDKAEPWQVRQIIFEREAAQRAPRRTAAPTVAFWLQLLLFAGGCVAAWVERDPPKARPVRRTGHRGWPGNVVRRPRRALG
jgi:tRNA A-37 threonylcarbamoyl transferase component Bud32